MRIGWGVLFLLVVVTATAPAAELENLEFMVGHWMTEALGGVAEEVWLPPRGDVMHGVFRLVADDTMQFSEFVQITAEKDGVRMRFAHFRPDYTTWEEAGEPLILTLAVVGEGLARFQGDEGAPDIEYRLDDEGRLNVTVSGSNEPFRFRRLRVGDG